MNSMRLESACAWIAFVALILGALAGNTSNFKVRPSLDDLDSPLLSMELLRTPADVAKIVGTGEHNDRAEMARLVHVDFAFIGAYSSLFILVGCLLYHGGSRLSGLVVAVLGVAAGVLDVMENFRILEVLQGAANTPRMFSLAKWATISIGLGILARVYISEHSFPLRRFIGYLAAFFSAISALAALSGVSFQIDPLIETGAQLMGISLILGWLFFATHAALAQGLLPALNRLAQWKGFRSLTTWPSDDS